MAEFKIVIGTKSGKCVQKEVKDAEAKPFLGKKIGDRVKGDAFGLAGYELEVTGGSDASGFPMRKDVPGTGRKRILAVSGVGVKKKRDGLKQRKTVCGNTVHAGIAQINCRVLKEGRKPLIEEASEEEAKPEAKGGKKPKDASEKKPIEQPEKEEKPKEAKEEKAKAEAKHQEKEEAEKKKPKTEEKAKENPKEKPEEEAKPEKDSKAEKPKESPKDKAKGAQEKKKGEPENKKDKAKPEAKKKEEPKKEGNPDEEPLGRKEK